MSLAYAASSLLFESEGKLVDTCRWTVELHANVNAINTPSLLQSFSFAHIHILECYRIKPSSFESV